jgi:hypothetical protein
MYGSRRNRDVDFGVQPGSQGRCADYSTTRFTFNDVTKAVVTRETFPSIAVPRLNPQEKHFDPGVGDSRECRRRVNSRSLNRQRFCIATGLQSRTTIAKARCTVDTGRGTPNAGHGTRHPGATKHYLHTTDKHFAAAIAVAPTDETRDQKRRAIRRLPRQKPSVLRSIERPKTKSPLFPRGLW